jgi:hypothetical protein
VTLASGEDEATGFAEGASAGTTRPRLVATATIDALRQLEPAADVFDVDHAHVTRVGAHDISIVTIVCVAAAMEQTFVGTALVRSSNEDATVRATLDATNRRLSFLAR